MRRIWSCSELKERSFCGTSEVHTRPSDMDQPLGPKKTCVRYTVTQEGDLLTMYLFSFSRYFLMVSLILALVPMLQGTLVQIRFSPANLDSM